jgi:hypothetical protein
MADRLRVTELDFDTIKNNLKDFLRQQNQFSDYDFEGSGLSILLDILAYNTHYNAYYLNMVANEAFLDTALLRDSVVSHAKSLSYIPHSIKAPTATINFTVESGSSTPSSLTIPRGYSFLSNQIDGKSYNFVVVEEVFVTKSNTQFIFENLEIKEGQLVTYNFTHDQSTNPKQIFTIPDDNIDTSTLKVTVINSSSNTEVATYTSAIDVLDLDNNSEVYFLQENRGGKFQVYFGNDVLGKKIPDGSILSLSYLLTNGIEANRANNFVATSPLIDSLSNSITNFVIYPIVSALGGSDRETVDSIKFLSTNQFSSQNRLVTKNDYGSYLRKNYTNADSISVWGGEDEIPKVYGKIFISIRPKENFFLSNIEKERIVNEILKPKSVVSLYIEIVDPDYLYIKTSTKVKYDKNKTNRTPSQLIDSVRNAILLYKQQNINRFNSNFILSKLENDINLVDISIIGSESSLRIEKRFEPDLNKTSSYVLNFNIPLTRGEIYNRLVSNEFRVNDGTIQRDAIFEEVPNSFTGLDSIEVIDPGFNYITAPTVTITGDGTGATAEAKIVNGKVNSITVTNRGINYTKAVITITGGGGVGAQATAVLSGKIGSIRIIYFDSNAERKIINPNCGTINYETGLVNINDVRILSLKSGSLLKINIEPENKIIESSRNIILTIDETDPTSISTIVESI